ncbi:MAG: ATP-binding protein [Actinomycetota bacterium]|nr:ATP-binding protein [Actinomycetota bacterium]
MRILAWYLVLLAGSSLASAVVAYQVLHARLADEIEAGLAQEAEELDRLAGGNNPATGQPFIDDAAAIFDTFLRRNIPEEGEALFTLVDGRPYKTSDKPPHDLLRDPVMVSRWAALGQSERSTVKTPAGEARYLAVPVRFGDRTVGSFVVANFPAVEQEEIVHSVRVVGAVSVGVLLVASCLAWAVAGRVLAPVRVLTATARRITETDLSRRIPVRGSDEIADLTATFNAMLDRLETAFASQRDFISDAGHELRTPITIIRGHLELMGDDPDERRETVDLVTDELDRMARYVGDLLLLAKAERPDFLQRERLDVGEFTHRLFAKAQAFDPERFRLAGVGVGEVVADPDRITQAVMNLADNSVRHTDGAGEILLGSDLVDGEARFWVRNHGPVIPESERARLFDRFARGEASAARDGTGLGLAIVAAIARAHGGKVELASGERQGTTFTIVVPAKPQEADAS